MPPSATLRVPEATGCCAARRGPDPRLDPAGVQEELEQLAALELLRERAARPPLDVVHDSADGVGVEDEGRGGGRERGDGPFGLVRIGAEVGEGPHE